MSWHRKDMVKSSAADNVFTTTTCCARVFTSIIYRKKRSVGIWICAGSDPCHTRDLEWESSVQWPGSVDLNTSVKRSRSRGCSIGCTPSLRQTLLIDLWSCFAFLAGDPLDSPSKLLRSRPRKPMNFLLTSLELSVYCAR